MLFSAKEIRAKISFESDSIDVGRLFLSLGVDVGQVLGKAIYNGKGKNKEGLIPDSRRIVGKSLIVGSKEGAIDGIRAAAYEGKVFSSSLRSNGEVIVLVRNIYLTTCSRV